MTFQKPGLTRQAFTLLELLIVIAILSILISILLPAANRIRRQAKVLQTQTTIATIRDAIAMYQADQRDWPGPFEHQGQRATGSIAYANVGGKDLTSVGPTPAAGTKLRPTRSEELFLCLTGGMTVKWGPAAGSPKKFPATALEFDEQDIGRGHMQMGPKNRGRLKDYVSGFKNRSGTGGVPAKINADDPTKGDTELPEFIDSFGGPILYVRARKGVNDISAYSGPLGPLEDEAVMYQTTPTYPNPKYPTVSPPRSFPDSYLSHGSLPNQSVEQDRFILLSAGADRKFGTDDDVANFGQPEIKIPTP